MNNIYTNEVLEKFNREQGYIWITGEIIEQTLIEVINQLLYYEYNNYSKITIFIFSPGGLESVAMSIRDYMNELKKKGCIIATVITANSASAATIIGSSGSLGERYISRSASETIHSVSSTVSGDIKVAERQMESFRKAQERVVKHYIDVTGKSEDVIRNAIAFDNEMNSYESINFGLADKIWSGVA